MTRGEGHELAPTPDEVPSGVAVYSKRVLAAYDIWVLGYACSLVWRCPRRKMLALYNHNIGAEHLDLGPGTGFFLDRCTFPTQEPRLALADLNETVLHKAGDRLRRYQPALFKCDLLQPFELDVPAFDSVGLNLVLHCLPGGMAHKATLFDHVRRYVRPNGRIFGCTVLGKGVRHSRLAKKTLESLNADKVMSNADDALEDLEAELTARFDRYRLWTEGSVGLFEITLD